MWEEHHRELLRTFREDFHEDLLKVFRGLMDKGILEVITSAATHGYLPLLGRDTCVQAQVKQGVAAYKRHFGREPKGFWLPECAYRPRYPWVPPLADLATEPVLRKGVEEFLSENGLDYFFIDSHLLKGGRAIGVYKDRFEALERLWERFASQFQERPEEQDKSPYQVYLVSSAPESKRPVAAFTRDPKTGLQVWSGEWGYPGDGNYLDFHKKRYPGGLRYWQVTSAKADLADKSPYHPEWINARINDQADHFVSLIVGILTEFREQNGRPGMVVAPYDTELLGHWWFEGPEWVYQVLSRLQAHTQVSLSPGSQLLKEAAPRHVIQLPEGSWGEGGYHWIWLNEHERLDLAPYLSRRKGDGRTGPALCRGPRPAPAGPPEAVRPVTLPPGVLGLAVPHQHLQRPGLCRTAAGGAPRRLQAPGPYGPALRRRPGPAPGGLEFS